MMMVPVDDLSRLSALDTIQLVMNEAMRPLALEEILSSLQKRGKAIGEATLQSYLSREDRFWNISRGFLGLSEWRTNPQMRALLEPRGNESVNLLLARAAANKEHAAREEAAQKVSR
jgi:hypothetical protein